MMSKGFHQIYNHSEEFKKEVVIIYNWIIIIAEKKLLNYDIIENINYNINQRLDFYIKKFTTLNNYIKLITNKTTEDDAELALSEVHYLFQIYYLYNEVFTYGVMEQVLIQQIKIKKLNVQDTLIKLSTYKGSAMYSLYNHLLDVNTSIPLKEFLYNYKNDKKFFNHIKKTYSEVLTYYEKDISLSTLYKLAKNVHNNKIALTRFSGKNDDFDKMLVELYLFITNVQKKLYTIQNSLVKSANMIFKKFPKIEQKYGWGNPITNLLTLYFSYTNKLKEYGLNKKYVYYKNAALNITEKKYFKLSVYASIVLNLLIKKQGNFTTDIPLIKLINTTRYLEEFGIIKKIQTIQQKPISYIFMLELALMCNLKCTICFNRKFKRNKILSFEDWKKVIYTIPKNSIIILFGGEPFLYPQIDKLISFIQSTNRKKDMNWKLKSFTNGVLTEKIISTLKDKDPINLIFSIDGLESAHDKIRGQKTFGHTIKTITRLKATTNHKIEVRSVITTNNYMQINKFISFFKKLGADKIAFADLHMGGDIKSYKDYSLKKKERERLLNHFGTPANLGLVANIDFKLNSYPNACGIGINRIYIRSDGMVNGCSELDIAESNIFKSELNEFGVLKYPRKLIPKFERDEVDKRNSDCYKCGIINLCGGGCRARALKETGDINKCDTIQKRDIENFLNKLII